MTPDTGAPYLPFPPGSSLVWVLDCTNGADGRPVLLDGKGGRLPPGAEPVYLGVVLGHGTNSRGEPYDWGEPDPEPDATVGG